MRSSRQQKFPRRLFDREPRQGRRAYLLMVWLWFNLGKLTVGNNATMTGYRLKLLPQLDIASRLKLLQAGLAILDRWTLPINRSRTGPIRSKQTSLVLVLFFELY